MASDPSINNRINPHQTSLTIDVQIRHSTKVERDAAVTPDLAPKGLEAAAAMPTAQEAGLARHFLQDPFQSSNHAGLSVGEDYSTQLPSADLEAMLSLSSVNTTPQFEQPSLINSLIQDAWDRGQQLQSSNPAEAAQWLDLGNDLNKFAQLTNLGGMPAASEESSNAPSWVGGQPYSGINPEDTQSALIDALAQITQALEGLIDALNAVSQASTQLPAETDAAPSSTGGQGASQNTRPDIDTGSPLPNQAPSTRSEPPAESSPSAGVSTPAPSYASKPVAAGWRPADSAAIAKGKEPPAGWSLASDFANIAPDKRACNTNQYPGGPGLRSLGENKADALRSLQAHGATEHEARLYFSILDMETNHGDASQRDSNKDHDPLMANYSALNMNGHMLEIIGFPKDKLPLLNESSPRGIDLSVQAFLQANRSMGEYKFINMHRGGWTGFVHGDASNMDTDGYRQGVARIMDKLPTDLSDPFFRNNVRFE